MSVSAQDSAFSGPRTGGAPDADRKGMLQESAAGDPIYDFSTPPGAPALCAPDSVLWRITKNPISMSIGGVCAVLLEFAEPRVRSGVWDHSIFPLDPIKRAKRTGMAAMMTVYGPAEDARKLIAGVTRLHSRVKGRTPEGQDYTALDPALTNWVSATTSYGFPKAYSLYVSELSPAEIDQAYREGEEGAKLFRAPNPPKSEAEFLALLDEMRPNFRPSPIVQDFLKISAEKSALPPPLSWLKGMIARAGVDMLPPDVRRTLELGPEYDLKNWERRLLKWAGRRLDKVCVKKAPPAQACLRMGLAADYLYR